LDSCGGSRCTTGSVTCPARRRMIAATVNDVCLRWSTTFDAPNKPTPVHGPWTYGHFCGAGGMGTPINSTDAACQTHDACYNQAGFSPGSNYQNSNAQLGGWPTSRSGCPIFATVLSSLRFSLALQAFFSL
jgi:hypothetical protein